MRSNLPIELWKATLIEKASGSKDRKDGIAVPDSVVRA
jgi:hypothetical protein